MIGNNVGSDGSTIVRFGNWFGAKVVQLIVTVHFLTLHTSADAVPPDTVAALHATNVSIAAFIALRFMAAPVSGD